MVAERDIVWEYYELTNFEYDKSGKLIDAYDLVIDSITCLAMEADMKSK